MRHEVPFIVAKSFAIANGHSSKQMHENLQVQLCKVVLLHTSHRLHFTLVF